MSQEKRVESIKWNILHILKMNNLSINIDDNRNRYPRNTQWA